MVWELNVFFLNCGLQPKSGLQPNCGLNLKLLYGWKSQHTSRRQSLANSAHLHRRQIKKPNQVKEDFQR